MRTIIITGQYKKDLRLARKRHLPEDKLNEVILKLANDEELPPSNKDHALYGDLQEPESVTSCQTGCLYIARKQTEN